MEVLHGVYVRLSAARRRWWVLAWVVAQVKTTGQEPLYQLQLSPLLLRVTLHSVCRYAVKGVPGPHLHLMRRVWMQGSHVMLRVDIVGVALACLVPMVVICTAGVAELMPAPKKEGCQPFFICI